MSVFYLLADSFLRGSTSASVLTALAVCIFVAFGGTKILSGFYKPMRRAIRVRTFRASRVYLPLIIWTALASAIAAVLLNLLVAVFSGSNFFGLTGFYPMLRGNMLAHPVLSFFLLAAMPADPYYAAAAPAGMVAAPAYGGMAQGAYPGTQDPGEWTAPDWNTEEYRYFAENPWRSVKTCKRKSLLNGRKWGFQ